jgi:hypothetical protein
LTFDEQVVDRGFSGARAEATAGRRDRGIEDRRSNIFAFALCCRGW